MPMIDTAEKAAFEALANAPCDTAAIETLARRLKAAGPAPTLADRLEFGTRLIRPAVAAPGGLVAAYDAAARGWLGAAVEGPTVAFDDSAAPVPAAFWSAFWTLIADVESGEAMGAITPRTAALGGFLDEGLRPLAARAALAFPGVAEAAAGGYPPRMTLEALAACPAGSLGHEFYRLIVDNGFDLEVLDREALGLADMAPPLDYLNARILQCHDLWHIVGGYRVTALHEVAISGFQMAQFGHGYSAMFLALMAASGAVRAPEAYSLIMDTIFTAWAHGRRSPPMIGIPWEDVWSETTPAIRARFGIQPYVSPYPADLFELLRPAA
jgi:ubiquinone biosynthesis protein Coq4